MKKAILIALALLVALPAATAAAETGPLTLLLAGSNGDDSIQISLSLDGREYEISSNEALEAGGDVCSHPEERPEELVCKAPAIAGIEVNTGGGNDLVVLGSDLRIPATLRGGPGRDRLIGGGVSDKILGGPGADFASGRRGDDWIAGGPGNDHLVGGPGNDHLQGGPGEDILVGGPGQNALSP